MISKTTREDVQRSNDYPSDRSSVMGDFLLLTSGPEIASNCKNNTEIYLHICIIFGLGLHNTDKIKVSSTVGMTAITAFQRFGGMMTILKERIRHDAAGKTAIVSE